MSYEKEILQVLQEAGQRGLSVKKISQHIFNGCNTLFRSADFADVHRSVARYLNRNSKNSGSPVERTEVRGVYRLNPRFRQFLYPTFEFSDQSVADAAPDVIGQDSDPSLPLF